MYFWNLYYYFKLLLSMIKRRNTGIMNDILLLKRKREFRKCLLIFWWLGDLFFINQSFFYWYYYSLVIFLCILSIFRTQHWCGVYHWFLEKISRFVRLRLKVTWFSSIRSRTRLFSVFYTLRGRPRLARANPSSSCVVRINQNTEIIPVYGIYRR